MIVPYSVGGSRFKKIPQSGVFAVDLVALTELVQGYIRTLFQRRIRIDGIAKIDKKIGVFSAGRVQRFEVIEKRTAVDFGAVRISGVSEANIEPLLRRRSRAERANLARDAAVAPAVKIRLIGSQISYE